MQDLKRKPRTNRQRPSSPGELTVAEFWYKDCKTPEDRAAKLSRLVSAKGVLDELKDYLEQRFAEAARVTSKNYDTPGWECQQAHRNGQMESLEDIWRLLP